MSGSEMPSDVVSQLRVLHAIEQLPQTMFSVTADEIERLRALVVALNDEAKDLRSERDEARRMACGALAAAHMNQDPFWRERVAKTLGWDCFSPEVR